MKYYQSRRDALKQIRKTSSIEFDEGGDFATSERKDGKYSNREWLVDRIIQSRVGQSQEHYFRAYRYSIGYSGAPHEDTERCFNHFPEIEEVLMSPMPRLPPEQLELVNKLDHLKVLKIFKSPCDAEHIAAIAPLNELEVLHFDCALFSLKELEKLRCKSTLKQLSFNDIPEDPYYDYSVFAQFPNLERLSVRVYLQRLNPQQRSRQLVKALEQLPKLKELDIRCQDEEAEYLREKLQCKVVQHEW